MERCDPHWKRLESADKGMEVIHELEWMWSENKI